MSIEYKVQQRSQEWFNLRKRVLVSASNFGDAIGVGRGKPYDFFISLISEDSVYQEDGTVSTNAQHGIDMEVKIQEAYQLITGCRIRESGFWVPDQGSPMKNIIGASPDGIVLDPEKKLKFLGLVEFKAPVYKIYSGINLLHGIPRHYIAQMQGQMAVCDAPWCDFMAVCIQTREIILKRVFFQPVYWLHASGLIKQFCHTLQEAQIRSEFGQDPTDFDGARKLQQIPVRKTKFSGEDMIVVKDLLETQHGKLFRGPSNVWMNFDFLMGSSYSLPPSLTDYGTHLLAKIDSEIT